MGSVWISWSTGIPTLVTNPAQLPQTPVPSPNRYADDYPQPPKYNFELQTQDPASVASQVPGLAQCSRMLLGIRQ